MENIRWKVNYGLDSAKALLQEAIDNGNVERGLLALYDLQLKNEAFEEAEQILDRLSQEFPDRDQDQLKYIELYEKQGKLAEAKELLLEEDYDTCIKLLEANEGKAKLIFKAAPYFLAKVYAKAGKLEEAKTIVQKEISIKTAQPIYYYLMASFLEKEDPKAAQENLDIALKFWADADANYIPLQRAQALADRLSS